jgi:hypothetical protein
MMLLSTNQLLGNHVAKLERNSLFSYGYDARNEHSAGATRNDSAEITSRRHSPSGRTIFIRVRAAATTSSSAAPMVMNLPFSVPRSIGEVSARQLLIV